MSKTDEYGLHRRLCRRLLVRLCGGEISRYTLFGVTWLVLILNALAANLRHTHVWLSFGAVIEHVLNSPAQHQIHQSDAPRHINKNFGINLSLWDWMFGTLYATTSKPESIRFGTDEQDHERYLTVYSLIVTPFVDIVRKIRLAKRPQAAAPVALHPPTVPVEGSRKAFS